VTGTPEFCKQEDMWSHMAVLILLGQLVGFKHSEEAYIVKLKGSSEVIHEMMLLMVPKMM
jgi:hypothetical protein